MACHHPIQAWRTPSGEIILAKQQADSTSLRLPCGGCLGCRLANAQAWALRCQLELQQHQTAVFTTLTYDDEHLPNALQKEDIQLWIKRLRKHKGPKSLRFFAAAEYGERTHRPHYHAILYGLSMDDEHLIQDKWNSGGKKNTLLGHTRTEPITPARIAYTAGYCQKKNDYKHTAHERVNPATGEVYRWEPPFKIMSMNPGIGGDAREWAKSWRLYAIKDGHKMPVPRYLHEAWKAQATALELEDLIYEKSKLQKNTTEESLRAQEIIAIRKQQLTAEKRTI